MADNFANKVHLRSIKTLTKTNRNTVSIRYQSSGINKSACGKTFHNSLYDLKVFLNTPKETRCKKCQARLEELKRLMNKL